MNDLLVKAVQSSAGFVFYEISMFSVLFKDSLD